MKKRPQLNLTELYQLKWILGGTLAVLSAWTILYMDVEAWLWLVLITVSVPLVLRWPVLTLYVPRWVHRLAFPLFVVLFATDYYLNHEPLPAMIRLAMMLVFYRAVTPRKRRDDLQLIVLGLFLVVVAGVLTASLAFAFQIVVFTGCTLVFLLVITLIDSAESGQAPAVYSASSPPVWMHIEWVRLAKRLHQATDWRVAMLGTGLFGGVVTVSALLFFALPRFEISNTFFLDNLMSKQSRSGFSENVRFSDVTDIQQDTSVALRVEVTDPRMIPSEPYWRMLVLDSYSSGVFGVSNDLLDQMRNEKLKAARIVGSARPRAGDAAWTFYLEGGTSRYLPLLGSFHHAQFSGGPQDYAINDELRILRLEKTPAKMFAYRVEGMRYESELGPVEVIQHRDPVPPTMMDSPGDYTGLPRVAAPMPSFLSLSLDAAELATITQWAKALGAPDGNAPAFARKACQWLAEQHGYSMQMTLPVGDGDPLFRWMRSTLPGHCELFAGAFTVLARSAGYPSRMVTGFRGGSWNAESGHLIIRNSDAHAWCEIFDKTSQAWVRVDPTPGAPAVGQQLAKESPEAVLARIRDTSWTGRLDSLRMFWYRRIVDFDQNSQAKLARDAKTAIELRAKQLKQLINQRLEAAVRWLQEPWDIKRLAAWIGVVVMAFALVLCWRNYGQGFWMRWRSGMTRRGVDPVRREAGRWLRRIEEVAPVVGDEERARVRAELERLRYGPRQSWPNPQGAFRRAKRVCR
ncbi:MAG: transglutaminaseTgpA domain-containing protein [Opitutaceae bacterium]